MVLSNIVEGKIIVVFQSTHITLKAEKELKEANIKVRTTIKPRTIGSNCQLALVVPPEDVRKAAMLVSKKGLSPTGYYMQNAKEEWETVKT
ncbi:MAG TPA: DUF3343 domain-containing protein [Nitrospinota bacterium]|nr:DUF3343 domain-containing protein [Nitrospinota bacterium]|tara:strand:+ start:109107 stop:109379 length:273 start_codon:yes stop_codon:yes gene_type:complete